MIEKVIDIQIKGNADQAVGSLKSQLREAQAEVATLSDKFGATSQEAINAAKRAGELKDRIGDAKALTDAFNPDAKFKALSASLSGVAGGFAAVQGGMALFGAESADVEKTLLKVQSAMALSQGLQSIGESVDSFKQLGAVVKNMSLIQGIYNFVQTGSLTVTKANTVATEAQAVATEVSAVATATASSGLKLFRLALIGTGIGAIVVGLGLLIANFDKVKEVVLKVVPGLAKVGEFIGNIVNSVTDFVGATSDATRAVDKLKETAENTLAVNKKFMQEHGDQLDEYTKKKIEAKNAYAEAVKEDGSNQIELAKRLNRELIAIEISRGEDKEKAQKEANEKAASKKKTEDDKKAKLAEEQRKIDEENIQKNFLKTIPELDDSLVELELSAIDAKNQSKRELDDKYKQDTLDAQKQFELQIAGTIYESESAREEREKEVKERKIKNYRDTTEAVGSIAKSGEDLLAQVQANGIAKGKAGQAAMKALALVQIGADSAIAFSKMMQGTESSAAGAASVAGPAAPAVYLSTKIAFYASGAATILANLARARALLSGGGGGGATAAGGGATGAAPSPPSFNIVGASGTNQIAQAIGGQQAQPVQAYVVAGAVTTGQSLNRNIIANASMG